MIDTSIAKIAVIDDESSVRVAFRDMLETSGYEVVDFARADACLEEFDAIVPDVVVMDICMPGISGLEALALLKQKNGRLPVIMMTGKGTMDTAIEAMKLGAFDYQLKPFEPAAMLDIVARAAESSLLMKKPIRFGEERSHGHPTDWIVGKSLAIQEVFKTIGRVARTDATVLIRGETGTGKELVARAIYQHSQRADRNLIIVNCAALPHELIESELFGYERGAFTGAHARRIGKFEQATGGTIFLDEIGELPIATQAKLLRVLQERTIERLGASETIPLDVRILAATNRPLESAIKSGEFREDLYHRLNVVEITLPPLRNRREDISTLAQFFAERFSAEIGCQRPIFSPEALERFTHSDWPGNVRQLEHCIHRLVILTQGQAISDSMVKQALAGEDSREQAASPEQSFDLAMFLAKHLESYAGGNPFDEMVERVERIMLDYAMSRANRNQSAAARLLGLNRTTLQAKLKRHRIDGV